MALVLLKRWYISKRPPKLNFPPIYVFFRWVKEHPARPSEMPTGKRVKKMKLVTRWSSQWICTEHIYTFLQLYEEISLQTIRVYRYVNVFNWQWYGVSHCDRISISFCLFCCTHEWVHVPPYIIITVWLFNIQIHGHTKYEQKCAT